MPIVIPAYVSHSTPGTVDRGGTSPESTGLPIARGLSSIAQAMADADIHAERMVADVARNADYVARKDRFDTQLGDLSLSLAKDPDHRTYFARARKGIEEASAEALSGVNDPALKTALNTFVTGEKRRALLNAQFKERELTVDYGRGVLEDSIDRNVKAAVAATDSADLMKYEGNIGADVNSGVAGGLWTAEHGALKRKAAREKIYTTLAMQMADREPSRFLANDREGLYTDSVDPLRLEEIRRYATHRSAAVDASVAATAVWDELGPKRDEDPINEDLMVRALESRFGEDPDKARIAVASLKEKVFAHDKGVKERKDANLSAVWKASLSGQGLASITAMPEYAALDGGTQRSVKEHLEDRAWMLSRRAEEDPRRRAAQHELYWRYSQPGVLAGMTETNITALYPSLGVELTDRLVENRRALDNPAKISEARVDQDDFNHYARTFGISPEEKKNKASLGEIKFSVENAIELEQQSKGRPLSRKEKGEIMRQGLTEFDVRVPLTFLGADLGTTTRKKRLFDVQYPGNIVIPPETRTKIAADLIARGLPATDDNVRYLYIQSQVK